MTVSVGSTAMVPVQVDVGELVHDVDWSRVPQRDGVYVLDGADPQIGAVRTRLVSGTFAAQSP